MLAKTHGSVTLSTLPFDQPTQNLSFGRPTTLRLAEPKGYNPPVSETALLYPRYAEPRLTEALTDSPVVMIHGPRECSKTTLARVVGERMGYAYLSFDDDVARGAAQADPAGFIADLPGRAILDEVQRVPALFAALKSTVDRTRVAGRFILTGSANVLLVPKLVDSLAGRMQILRLHPLAQCELARRVPGFLNALFENGFKTRRTDRLAGQLAERISGGACTTQRAAAGRLVSRLP